MLERHRFAPRRPTAHFEKSNLSGCSQKMDGRAHGGDTSFSPAEGVE